MASATVEVPVATAKVAGNFVKQFYNVMGKNPQDLYKFYKDDSVLCVSRCSMGGGQPGTTVSVKGKREIRNTVSALTIGKATILNMDFQETRGGGMLVLVTGFLNIEGTLLVQHFTQSFFLDKQAAPSPGYYVLHDMLRYVSAPAMAQVPIVLAQGCGMPEAAFSHADAMQGMQQPMVQQQQQQQPMAQVPVAEQPMMRGMAPPQWSGMMRPPPQQPQPQARPHSQQAPVPGVANPAASPSFPSSGGAAASSPRDDVLAQAALAAAAPAAPAAPAAAPPATPPRGQDGPGRRLRNKALAEDDQQCERAGQRSTGDDAEGDVDERVAEVSLDIEDEDEEEEEDEEDKQPDEEADEDEAEVDPGMLLEDEGPSTWASMASRLKQGSGALGPSKVQGFAVSAAASPKGPGIADSSSGPGPSAPSAPASALAAPPQARAAAEAWLWVSRLPQEPAAEAQEVMDALNASLATWGCEGSATQLERREPHQEWASVL
ncbi:unnamed protein product, partial [Prorocentrum cordatum]